MVEVPRIRALGDALAHGAHRLWGISCFWRILLKSSIRGLNWWGRSASEQGCGGDKSGSREISVKRFWEELASSMALQDHQKKSVVQFETCLKFVEVGFKLIYLRRNLLKFVNCYYNHSLLPWDYKEGSDYVDPSMGKQPGTCNYCKFCWHPSDLFDKSFISSQVLRLIIHCGPDITRPEGFSHYWSGAFVPSTSRHARPQG